MHAVDLQSALEGARSHAYILLSVDGLLAFKMSKSIKVPLESSKRRVSRSVRALTGI